MCKLYFYTTDIISKMNLIFTKIVCLSLFHNLTKIPVDNVFTFLFTVASFKKLGIEKKKKPSLFTQKEHDFAAENFCY